MTRSAPHLSKHQQGFAAVAALFLVVALAAMGGYMVTFSSSQQLTSAQDIQGTRAYWAARAGLEWGFASVSAGACPASPHTLTVEGFTVDITCTASAYTDGGNSVNILRLQSVAHSGSAGTTGFVERSISAAMEM